MSSGKFRNRYRIASARAQWWDYGHNAAYFITICTAYRKNYFGKITNRKMILSDIGKIADDCWMNIPAHFPFVDLGQYIIMPNHVHGIVIINKNKLHHAANTTGVPDVVGAGTVVAGVAPYVVGARTAVETRIAVSTRIVETRLIASLQQQQQQREWEQYATKNAQNKKTGGFAGNKNPMINDNLSHVIRWYKGCVAFASRKIYAGFAWQGRFHDHIIRDDNNEYRRISCYIRNNPANWKGDRFYCRPQK
jgi:hypothetical protein